MFALEARQEVVFVTTPWRGSEGIMEFLENQSPLHYLSLSINFVLSVSVSLETLLWWCEVDGNNSRPKAVFYARTQQEYKGAPTKQNNTIACCLVVMVGIARQTLTSANKTTICFFSKGIRPVDYPLETVFCIRTKRRKNCGKKNKIKLKF